MADRLSLYNGALVSVLGERALASLSEERAARRYLDTVWANGAVDKMLMMGQWKFARRNVRMDYDSNLQPEFGWQFAFSRPNDFIRTLELTWDEFFQSPLELYHEHNEVFYAAIGTFYMGYVSNDAAYGGNLGHWPPNFTEFAEHWLAKHVLASLTGNKTDRLELEQLTQRAMTRAQSTDAMEGATRYPPAGTWVISRMRGRVGGWDRGSRTNLIGP